MKKILISAVALVFGVTAMNAQSPWFLGGEVGVNFAKGFDKTKVTEFHVNPQVGYMLNDNWGLMLDLDFSTMSTKADGVDSVTDYSWFGGGIGAIYKLQIVDKFFYAPTLRVGFAAESEGDLTDITANLNFFRFEFKPSCNWGLNFNFGGIDFLNRSIKDVDDSYTEFGLNVFNATAVGFTYYF